MRKTECMYNRMSVMLLIGQIKNIRVLSIKIKSKKILKLQIFYESKLKILRKDDNFGLNISKV